MPRTAGGRSLEPEWLDSLDPADPRSRRARRELRLVNRLMRNASIVSRALAPVAGPAARIADLGAGDGRFMLQVAQRLAPRAALDLTLVDRQSALEPATLAAFRALGWHAQPVVADVLNWLEQAPPFDAIVANLFLHHLEPAALERLLALAASRARVFVACEPRRGGLALFASRLLGLAGCGSVSRHDAVASVRAGFAGRELSLAWRNARGWQLSEGARGLFSHVFVAQREFV